VNKVLDFFRQKSPLPLKYGDIIFGWEGKRYSGNSIHVFDGHSFLSLENFPIYGARSGQVLPKQFVCFGLSRFREPDYFLPLLGLNEQELRQAEEKILIYGNILGFNGWINHLVWFRLGPFLDQIRANITINDAQAYLSKYPYKKTFFEYEIQINGKKSVKRFYLLQDFVATEPDQFDRMMFQLRPETLLWGTYRVSYNIRGPIDQEFLGIQLESIITDHPSTGKRINHPHFNPEVHLYPSGDVVPKLRNRSFTITWNSFVPLSIQRFENEIKFVILPTDLDNILQDLKDKNLPLQKGDLVNLVFSRPGEEYDPKERSILSKAYQREIRIINGADFNFLIFDGEKLIFPDISLDSEGNYPSQFLCFEKEYFEPDYFVSEFYPGWSYFYSNPDVTTDKFSRRLVWFRPHQFLAQIQANLYNRDGRQASFFLSEGKKFVVIDETSTGDLFKFTPSSTQVYAAYYNESLHETNISRFARNLYIRDNHIEL
jgi:hypothetical protein